MVSALCRCSVGSARTFGGPFRGRSGLLADHPWDAGTTRFFSATRERRGRCEEGTFGDASGSSSGLAPSPLAALCAYFRFHEHVCSFPGEIASCWYSFAFLYDAFQEGRRCRGPGLYFLNNSRKCNVAEQISGGLVDCLGVVSVFGRLGLYLLCTYIQLPKSLYIHIHTHASPFVK